jgi:oligosaccharyltransferase complex subunit beta
MFSFKRLVLLGAAFAGWVNAKSSTGNSVLVVVEPNRKDDFSIFFDGLKSVFSFEFDKLL